MPLAASGAQVADVGAEEPRAAARAGLDLEGPSTFAGEGTPHRITQLAGQRIRSVGRGLSFCARLSLRSCSDPLQNEADDEVPEQVGVSEPHAMAHKGRGRYPT
jgi:hypothetical protein